MGSRSFFAPNGRERLWSCMQVLKALARVPRKYEQCIAMLNWQLSSQAHHGIRNLLFGAASKWDLSLKIKVQKEAEDQVKSSPSGCPASFSRYHRYPLWVLQPPPQTRRPGPNASHQLQQRRIHLNSRLSVRHV